MVAVLVDPIIHIGLGHQTRTTKATAIFASSNMAAVSGTGGGQAGSEPPACWMGPELAYELLSSPD